MTLTEAQISQYRTEGWVAPINVMSEDEASGLAAELEAAEAAWPEHFGGPGRNNAHLAFPFLNDITTDPRIVDAASCLVGPDIGLTSTVLFIKEPDSDAYVSWHQDSFYMGLRGDNFVTAWLALTPSTLDTGCVTVIPGTHQTRLEHQDTFGDDNILTRGQQIPAVDVARAVHLELRPGQMSLHHHLLVHGSQPNRSPHRRVGFAMQSYMGADVLPARGEHHVMHVQGAPLNPLFIESARPEGVCTPEALAVRAAANEAFASVLYDGAEVRRQL